MCLDRGDERHNRFTFLVLRKPTSYGMWILREKLSSGRETQAGACLSFRARLIPRGRG
jgi:hypothetical protein